MVCSKANTLAKNKYLESKLAQHLEQLKGKALLGEELNES